MTFIETFHYNGYAESAPNPLIRDIREYCKKNYCEPISISPIPDCVRTSMLVVMQYKGPISKKIDTNDKIPNSSHFYSKCSKCGFHLVEPEMTDCPGCASHFVREIAEEVEI